MATQSASYVVLIHAVFELRLVSYARVDIVGGSRERRMLEKLDIYRHLTVFSAGLRVYNRVISVLECPGYRRRPKYPGTSEQWSSEWRERS